MRPVRLVAEGFTAFRDRVEVDFEDVDFFAIVGTTGSGKSSLIDAMCFALYGAVPRYDDLRRVGMAVSTGGAEARVGFTFDVDGRRHVATRVIRRRADGGATTKEARLERVPAGGGETEVVAGTAAEVSAAVADLLGLSFEHFTRCVVLPQGEFARFLHDKPSDRQDLLVRLLNLDVYTRMGGRARQVAAEAAVGVEAGEKRLQALAFATEEALAAATARLDALRALRADVVEARPELERLEGEATAAAQAREEARASVDHLERVAVPDAVRLGAARLAAARQDVVTAEAAVAEAEESAVERAAAAAVLPPLAALDAARTAHEHLARRGQEADEAADDVTAARQQAEASSTAVARAAARYDAATSQLEAVRRDHAAHALAATLVAGQPCPVCRTTVSSVPTHGAPAALGEAEAAVAEAQDRHSHATVAHQQALAAVARAEAALAAAERERARLAQEVAAHPDPVALDQRRAEVTAAHETAARARQVLDEARRHRDGARAQADRWAHDLAQLGSAFDAQRDPLVPLGPPAPSRTDLAADWEALAAWAAATAPVQRRAAETADATAGAALEAQQRRRSALRQAALALDVPAPPEVTLAALGEAVVEVGTETRQAVGDIVAGRAEAATLMTQVEAARSDADVARALGQLLSSQHFERWLVSEALQLLADDASTTLLELSDGQYSLTLDERSDFCVVDHANADERRSARTLSGGETFQASLALALALARQLADLASDGAARLEAIFLDEGFGTLDHETLETVAATIENLGRGGRMVGVVTHVQELAERVPVRFVVTKGPRTATVDKVVA